MNILVIGAGMMGSAMAYDLAHSPNVEKVLLADINVQQAQRVASTIGKNIEPCKLDINFYDDFINAMSDMNASKAEKI